MAHKCDRQDRRIDIRVISIRNSAVSKCVELQRLHKNANGLDNFCCLCIQGDKVLFTGLPNCARMVGVGCPLLLEVLGQTDPTFQKWQLPIDIHL